MAEHRSDAALADDAAALPERVDVALNGFDIRQLGAPAAITWLSRQEIFPTMNRPDCGNR